MANPAATKESRAAQAGPRSPDCQGTVWIWPRCSTTEPDLQVVALGGMEGVVALEHLDDLGHGRADPGHRRLDVDEVDAASRPYQHGQVVHDRLLVAAVVREDVAQHGDVVGTRVQAGGLGAAQLRAGLTQTLGGDERIGPVNRVSVAVDPRHRSTGTDDVGHRDQDGTWPAADIDDIGTRTDPGEPPQLGLGLARPPRHPLIAAHLVVAEPQRVLAHDTSVPSVTVQLFVCTTPPLGGQRFSLRAQ